MMAKPAGAARQDFRYYATVIKPELRRIDQELYKKVMSKDTLLKEAAYGVSERRNYS